MNNIFKRSGHYEVICPKCLTHITFDESTRHRLLNAEIKIPNPKGGDDIREPGGCPGRLREPKEGEDEGDVPVCGNVFPLRYLNNVSEAPPMFVQVFGWSLHGKTVFLDALRLMLFDMRTLWSDFVHQSVTQEDMEYDKILRQYQLHGYLADSTQKKELAETEISILQLNNMVRWGSRTLVVMDQAGERFDVLDGVPVDKIPFLQYTTTAFMLISLPQLFKEQGGRSVDQLLNIYIETILRIEEASRNRKQNNRRKKTSLKRKLVVVLTMADIIHDLPPHLRNYVVSDETWFRLRTKGIFHMSEYDMAQYLERMEWVSNEIREWLLRDTVGVPGGSNFVGLIESSNFEVRYTLISATGHDDLRKRPKGSSQNSGDGVAGIEITPKRVLDPFYWALEFQSS
jgi:hypothetical protein